MNENQLFEKGINAFNDHSFYDAHEYLEELWSEFHLTDRLFVQGLIQLAVAYYHITNSNIKGARSLFNKCLLKLKQFPGNHRDLNMSEVILKAEDALDNLECIVDCKDFNWNHAPTIK